MLRISSGRVYTEYDRKVTSPCTLDVEHAGVGKELTLICGEPGTRQKQIRTRVAGFLPYLALPRNASVDARALPGPS